jgi:hypothetical protein
MNRFGHGQTPRGKAMFRTKGHAEDAWLKCSRDLLSLKRAAKDVHDYLRENCPDIIDISTTSELAADSLKDRLQRLYDLLNGPSTGESPIGLKETSSGSLGRAHQFTAKERKALRMAAGDALAGMFQGDVAALESALEKLQ